MKLSRREFIKKTAAASAAAGLAGVYSGCRVGDEKPNIIFIMADDLGYGDLSCYGQEFFRTPNIDHLAEQGMRFTQHYAGSTVCAPSRCVLMTGKHTGHAVVRGNRQAVPHGQMPLPADETTVAAALKQAGYATGCFGKWGLGLASTSGDPQKHGFDTFCGYYDQVRAHNAFPEFIYKNGEKIYLDNEVVYMPEDHWSKGLGSYSTEKNEYARHVVADEALKFIQEHQNQPFFLYFSTTIPHDNGEAPDGAKNEVPEIHPDYLGKPWSREQKQYASVIRILDDYVGRIQAKLKELALEENTLILFTSDNGPVPAFWCQAFRSSGALRGAKRDLYEGGIRVPFIAKWPAQVQAGAVSEHVSAFWDIFPTLCDIAGAPAPERDGISMLPELTGAEQPEHEYLYWEFYWWGPPRQAVRKGGWKAVRQSGPDSPIELYLLTQDPGEQKNLAEKYPEKIVTFERIFNSAHTGSELWELS